MQWVDFKRQQSKVNLETFSVFMENLADKALEVSYEGARLEEASKGKRRENSSAVKGFVHVTDGEVQECCCHHIQRKMLDDPTREKLNENNMASTERPKPERNCAVFGKPGHFGKQCDEFRSMSLEDRWKRVQTLNLCPLCLYSHGANRCWSKRRCGINRCEQNHHPLLHWEPTGPQHVVASCNSHRQCDQSVMFRIVPVMLYNNGKQLETLALIDEGSSVTLIDTELARLLEADGVHEPLKMKWTNGISQTESDSVKFTLCISDQQQSCQSTLADVRTVAKLNLPVQGLDSDELKERFDYLQKIELPNYTAAAPKLLIGINNIHLIAPLESRIGEAGEPVAIRCKLGWTIYGPRDGAVASVQFIGLHHCGCDACCKPDQEMNNALKEFFQLEAVGISPVNLKSKEDKRAREILERTTKRIGNRFETGLLWAEDDVVFPDSFPMAVKRWKSLQVRMDRNSGISENIAKQLQEYVDKGYAHRITEQEIKDTEPGKAWYLPINYVLNPNKPGKVRIVWDAAAKVQGVSLNDRLLKGPDMISSLPSVIHCFRERKVAFGGDIREMFHQIRIRSQDRQAQRFLFGSDSKGEPQIYVMDVVIFGASCTPCTSQYVKNLNGLEHAEKYPEASQAIMKKHFVDDYFDSADTEEEAIKRASEVREIHAAGGFEIRNWVSNSQEVLKSLGEISAKQTRIVEVNKTTEVERVLGVRWNSQNDVFVFSMNLREDLQPYLQEGAWPTKRIALKCIMSMFDPKQFLAPLLIHGRILMQDVWRSGIGWDEKLLQAQYDVWVRWTSILSLAEAVEVPRCYLGTASSTAYSSVQLHIFVDAGENAYGSVAYFRFSDEKGVHCSFIEAKAKVAPLQYLSIPRKELQSATLGAQLAKSIKINHSFPIYKTVFWTDSKAVFSWIRSERRKYKKFVAHRVGQILEVSNPEDWRWVPTKDNAADDLTKWSKSTEIHSDSRWFRGPQFLYFAEQHWPLQTQEVEEFQEELRASVLFQNVIVSDGLSMRIGNVFKWTVLVRMVATVLRYMSNCKRCVQNLPIESLRTEAERTNNQLKLKPGHYVPLRQEEYFAAENCLWRLAQREEYADEVATLLKQKDGRELKLERSSLLFDKSPFLDEFGVVRMEGRTERAEYASFDSRFPIILPKNHLVTKRLVDEFHRKSGHASRETVVNEIRQRFFINNLRAVVDKVISECQWCRIQKAKPQIPRMAPLPKQRMAVGAEAFSYVGLDYFGPLEVSIGRRREKRWVALFTCMTTRAVHLEVAYNLTTESCKMAVRRFVRRRRSPIEIFSDNGTNFVGASRELALQIRRINEGCADTFTSARTRWVFNLPSAPHMGGVWERMVRSVKVALNTLTDGGRLTDEILNTALVEVEDLINSRPLTYVSTNVKEDPEAFKPNHFMKGISAECLPPRNPIEVAEALRSKYVRAQQLADGIWNRWQAEYLPKLNKRPKWFNDVRQMQPGDLVFALEDNKRERGVVSKVFLGSDGRVRSAAVKTSKGEKTRPVSKLAVLEMPSSKPNEENRG
ncbi:uncharacterized protein LOC129743473 [Uranotaenia lowii]|uniref:uncharacterized protein LOC129743473 n=1 Tax=Uranotaenia lowii TaxID=190385 RepID=UPI002479D54F|nr:uncharacterized protein LOC129743473 [Uranotaenia lowii]